MAGKGQGGRKRKPQHLKVIEGTARKDRTNDAAPTPAKERPVAPQILNERATELFNSLAAELEAFGIASSSFTHMMMLLAMRLEEIEVCTVMIEDEGRTYVTTNQQGDTMHRSRPEVAQRNEAMRHAQSLMAEFGLSPAQIEKISRGGQGEENPFAEFS